MSKPHMKGYTALRKRIYVRDEGRCWRCGQQVAWDDYDLDHIVARALGGSDDESNLAVTDKACNRRAGQRLRQPGVHALPHAERGRW